MCMTQTTTKQFKANNQCLYLTTIEAGAFLMGVRPAIHKIAHGTNVELTKYEVDGWFKKNIHVEVKGTYENCMFFEKTLQNLEEKIQQKILSFSV